ncbi:MAG: PepSY domain-containing protein, partial [Pseudomonas sp.]|nr:PepSY domain-containing protein [Pseudomonas sp.]
HIEVGGPGWYPLLFQTADINPYNGAIEGSRMIADRSGLELVTESMRPLHTGDFGGLWVKLIWFFFGLILSMMVLSGLLIWTKRTALATANALKRSEKPRRAAALTAHSQQPEEANV